LEKTQISCTIKVRVNRLAYTQCTQQKMTTVQNTVLILVTWNPSLSITDANVSVCILTVSYIYS